MNKEEKIKKILNYLNSRMSAMSKPETEKIKKIVEDDDITLQEVVEWYIDYVRSH
jgi:DNA replication protein DnaD